MFQDKRGKKIVLVAHCFFNQNSKIDECAHYPGAILEAAKALINTEVGIIQMPCPEMFYLGLDRQADPKVNRAVASEDTRVAKRMQEEQSKILCKSMADSIVYQVEEYTKHGFHIVGLIGMNGSPTCGVNTNWQDGQELEGKGIFIEILEKALKDKEIFINMVGITARNPKYAVSAVENLCCDQPSL